MSTVMDESKLLSPSVSTKRRARRLIDFLTHGTEKRYNPFDLKDDDIRIWIDSEKEDD